jgi:four helix bundle protein
MKFDLEERLIEYSVLILEVVESSPDNKGANHLTGQLVRSGTAPALVYSEACGAESRRDFIHKMKIGLKELRETLTCLKIIQRKKYLGPSGEQKLKKALDESTELISIFVKSIKTSRENMLREMSEKTKIQAS